MKRLYFLSLILIILSSLRLTGQQTVGLFQNSPEAYNGYTLFVPIMGTTTYMVDNCGELIHSWESSYPHGMTAYLQDDGTLLRAGRVGSQIFTAGGNGGIIEMLDWDGNVIWDYTIASDIECQHHDFAVLPNGNILVIVWDSYTAQEAADAGRVESSATLWSDKIVEIEPDLENGGGSIVWEWKAWDHLVQDVDPEAENFGVVADSPGLIDINYGFNAPTNEDWLHFNSVAYNVDLDQIVISVHAFGEIWVIDHSTTTAEASGHTGGNAGQGGDLIYRWGNPQAYDQGDDDDQKLFRQHNAHWIEEGYQDEGMLMIFNNQSGSPDGEASSSVNVIAPPMDASGIYTYDGGAYGPAETHWTYQDEVTTDFFALNKSGATRQPNGNTLICEGPNGRFFEVDYEGNKVWEYISPINNFGVIDQGEAADFNNVFRAERYPPDHPGLLGQDLEPQGYIESGSTFECDLFVTSVPDNATALDLEVSYYPNPAHDHVFIDSPIEIIRVSLYDLSGKRIGGSTDPLDQYEAISLDHLVSGIYLLEIEAIDRSIARKKLVIERP